MKISVFQAFTLLARRYRGKEEGNETYKKIKQLYLSGITCENDQIIVDQLFKDELLSQYTISDDWHEINEDPVRRYFESTLSYLTLTSCIDTLNLELLKLNLQSICNHIPLEDYLLDLKPIFDSQKNEGESLMESDKEFFEAIFTLALPDSYSFLKPIEEVNEQCAQDVFKDRKTKISLLVKSACAGLTMVCNNNEDLPLGELYLGRSSLFNSENRGREKRHGLETSKRLQARSQNYGIMRSYMPLPADDELLALDPANFLRPADVYDFLRGPYKIPREHFATKVTPFVASISGTVLALLRALAFLKRKDQLAFTTYDCGTDADRGIQVVNYFRALISFLVYFSGGHSLKEFTRVLELERVQFFFKRVPGFKNATLEYLFKIDNDLAFENAVERTIVYNQTILARKMVQGELRASRLTEKILISPHEQLVHHENKQQLIATIKTTQSALEQYNPPGYLSWNSYIYELFTWSYISSERLTIAIRLLNQLIDLLTIIEYTAMNDRNCSFLADTAQKCNELGIKAEVENDALSLRHGWKPSTDSLHRILGLFKNNSQALFLKIKKEELSDSDEVDQKLDQSG